MTSQLTVHFYLPDATRTACKLPICAGMRITRFSDQTECQACIETAIWEEVAALAIERALLPTPEPWPQKSKSNTDWSSMFLEEFKELENRVFPGKYLVPYQLFEIPQSTPAVGSSSPTEPGPRIPSPKPQKAREP